MKARAFRPPLPNEATELEEVNRLTKETIYRVTVEVQTDWATIRRARVLVMERRTVKLRGQRRAFAMRMLGPGQRA